MRPHVITIDCERLGVQEVSQARTLNCCLGPKAGIPGTSRRSRVWLDLANPCNAMGRLEEIVYRRSDIRFASRVVFGEDRINLQQGLPFHTWMLALHVLLGNGKWSRDLVWLVITNDHDDELLSHALPFRTWILALHILLRNLKWITRFGLPT